MAFENSDWKDGFLFLGNQLALDLLNTRPIHHGQLIELLPDFRALLRWFRAADLMSRAQASDLERRWQGSKRAERAVTAIRAFREKLRSAALAWEGGDAVPVPMIKDLNTLTASHPMRHRLVADGKSLRSEIFFETREPEDLLAPVARAAAELFAHEDCTRVRKCDQCVLHFLDVSKKGTRRWCSMRLCGNRRKAAAFAARQRRGRARNT